MKLAGNERGKQEPSATSSMGPLEGSFRVTLRSKPKGVFAGKTERL